MNRHDLIFIIDAALANGQARYAREAAQAWLAEWPGDLRVQLLLGKALREEGRWDRALAALEVVASADPENSHAQRMLGEELMRFNRNAEAAIAFACVLVLEGLPEADFPKHLRAPAWLAAVKHGKALLDGHDWEAARTRLESALLGDPPTPLPFLLYLQSFWRPGLHRSASPLAEVYQKRWPRCVAVHLALAECLLQNGNHARAVEVLHSAASLDTGGEVAARCWGEGHPYRQLWPEHPGTTLPRPLPADVAAALGLNRLSAAPETVGEEPDRSGKVENARGQDDRRNAETDLRASTPTSGASAQKPQAEAPRPSTPANGRKDNRRAGMPAPAETLLAIEEELNRVASEIARYKRSPDVDKRRPAYLAISSKTRLIAKYGPEGFAALDQEMDRAGARLRRSHNWPVYVLYVDEPQGLAPFGLRPVNPLSAWDIKKLLADLDEALSERKEMIGAVLIVGGDDVLPFHRLPNPTDDVDGDVPSDNPYATRDENYFIPEWPVGRLPSGRESDPAPLLYLLRRLGAPKKGQGSGKLIPGWLAQWLAQWLRPRRAVSVPSFGYAASIWKSASLDVFSSIGEPRRLVTSPPVDSAKLPPQALAPSRFSYFNLHGLEDGPEWYGQRPPDEPNDGMPEYPVALRPSDVMNSGRAPEIVFSEACYGGNIQNKSTDEALSLKFLASGTSVVIASTKIAYGSITTPLIAADLMSKLCWLNVMKGLPLGEAVRRGKLSLAQEMHRRQGYLDGEDQKTLISFVLYGDPLYTVAGIKPKSTGRPHGLTRRKSRPAPLPALDNRPQSEGWQDGVDKETLAQVKSIVAQYLPGMGSAEVRVWQPKKATQAKGSDGGGISHRKVVSIAKTHHIRSRDHHQIARLTLDENGKVLKLAVSR